MIFCTISSLRGQVSSSTYAQVAWAKLCGNHEQYTGCLSPATCCVPSDKKGHLDNCLTELKGEETEVPGRNPWLRALKCRILKPNNLGFNRASNPRTGISGMRFARKADVLVHDDDDYGDNGNCCNNGSGGGDDNDNDDEVNDNDDCNTNNHK